MEQKSNQVWRNILNDKDNLIKNWIQKVISGGDKKDGYTNRCGRPNNKGA